MILGIFYVFAIISVAMFAESMIRDHEEESKRVKSVKEIEAEKQRDKEEWRGCFVHIIILVLLFLFIAIA